MGDGQARRRPHRRTANEEEAVVGRYDRPPIGCVSHLTSLWWIPSRQRRRLLCGHEASNTLAVPLPARLLLPSELSLTRPLAHPATSSHPDAVTLSRRVLRRPTTTPRAFQLND